MPDAIEKLVTKWRKSDVAFNRGATSEELDQFERDFVLRLPSDFRKLYSLCDGTLNGDFDDCFFTLWPLARIREEKGVWWHEAFDGHYVRFADAMICAPTFALRLPRNAPSDIVAEWDIGLPRHEVVARSAADFAAKHLAGRLPGPLY